MQKGTSQGKIVSYNKAIKHEQQARKRTWKISHTWAGLFKAGL